MGKKYLENCFHSSFKETHSKVKYGSNSLQVPKHENGKSEPFAPVKAMLSGHSKGTISTQNIFV